MYNTTQHKKKRKFKLLLDSAFTKPENFPKTVKKDNVTHIVHTYRFSPQTEDEHIYQKAVEEDRFVVTINYDDFRRLVKRGKPGVIGIESQLSNKQIDEKLSQFLAGKNPDDYYGTPIKITDEYLT